MFGFLFKSESITYADAFNYIGYIVIAVAVVVFVTRFNKVPVIAENEVLESRVAIA